MKKFMDENFLLQNKTAEKLYHDFAKHMPIIDYHCHLKPKEIAEDKKYRNITDLWLGGDHYKWRAMRINGIDEHYITGNAKDKEKFMKWAETIPYCIGNPLYHWTHLELKRYFGIDYLLSPKSAEKVWKKCNAKLQSSKFSSKELVKRSKVKVVCTTDDPVDKLEYHSIIAKDRSFGVKVLPTMRNDMCVNIEKDSFIQWVEKLSKSAEISINNFDDFREALTNRIKYFDQNGCRISDLALESVAYCEVKEEEVDKIFKKALANDALSREEIEKYKTYMIIFLGREYHRFGWVMQLHIGAVRSINHRMFKILGPDTGFDSIDDSVFANHLVKLLNTLEEMEQLPKTILYCLNPRDNEVLSSIIGCFHESNVYSKIQFGPGWWFNDQKNGMEKQMTVLANLSLLSRFIGMTTDSRSFLSYSRHEYFRRILCNLIGKWAENGEAPNDRELLGDMVKNICFNNAKEYFKV